MNYLKRVMSCMHKFLKPWFKFSGMKKKYYEERRMLYKNGFTESKEDANGVLSFSGIITYKSFSINCTIALRATHPLHAPISFINSINGEPFPDCLPIGWRHVAQDGTLCLFNDKRDKWSSIYTSSDIIYRIQTWLSSNVDRQWTGIEVDGPDPSFWNPAIKHKATYVPEIFMNIPDDVSGTLSFYYFKDEKKASACLKSLKYLQEGEQNECIVEDDSLIPYILPVSTKDIRSGYFITIDEPLPYRTEERNLKWMLKHPLFIQAHHSQQKFWVHNAIKNKKPLPGYPPLAIAVRYKDERTAAYLHEHCWTFFIMEGGNLSKAKGQYYNYPPVYLSESERMVRSTQVQLHDKKIAVVGCGTIGGEIALQLGKNGVSQLRLYDYDYLSVGNTYRHVLNWKDVQSNKTDALKLQIYSFNPYCRIETSNWSVDRTLTNTEVFLKEVSNYDLVVITVGDRDSYYYISWVLKKQNIPHVIVWSNWGAWGAEIVFIGSQSGCLNCYDLWKKDQIINKLMESPSQTEVYDGGCGFPTTPGNSFDLNIVSNFVIKKIVDSFQGGMAGYHQIQLNHVDDSVPYFTAGSLPPHDRCRCSVNIDGSL